MLWAGRLGRVKSVAERKREEAVMSDDALPAAHLVTFNIEQEIDAEASPADVVRSLTLDIVPGITGGWDTGGDMGSAQPLDSSSLRVSQV